MDKNSTRNSMRNSNWYALFQEKIITQYRMETKFAYLK